MDELGKNKIEEEIYNLEIIIQEKEAEIEKINCFTEVSEEEYEKYYSMQKDLEKEIKELNKQKKALEESIAIHSKFYYLPKGLKVHFILSAIFFFPIISWSVIPLWKWLCAVLLTALGGLLDSLDSTYNFLYYVVIFLSSIIMSLVGLVISFLVLKEKQKTDDKKTFNAFWWISLSLIIMMMIYQIWQMIVVVSA